MNECNIAEKSFCWNGCDDILKESIRRSKYVKKVRSDLLKKKDKKTFKK